MRADAEVLGAIAHRGRPLQVQLGWCAPPATELAGLARMLRRLRRT